MGLVWDSWILGFVDSWIRGLVDSWIRGFGDSWIRMGFVWDSYGIRGSSVGWVRGAFASASKTRAPLSPPGCGGQASWAG